MEYKVLYRKYRPQNFDEVVGQKYIVDNLKHSIKNNKQSHAYLFTGPRGTGKTSIAKIFAKSLNCLDSKDGNPCEKCSSCLEINNNSDILEMDAASNNGVDEIREIINNVRLAPSFAKYKIYIIDEVHMLSNSAFNALLLTLEDPPSHIIFILATTEVQNVPLTILSRCQRYDFKKINQEAMIEKVKEIADKEKLKINDDAILELVELADGSLRDALSILDQLIKKDSKVITLETISSSFGLISNKKIKEIIENIEENNILRLQTNFIELEKSGVHFHLFVKKLVEELTIKAINLKKETSICSRLTFKKIKEMILAINDHSQLTTSYNYSIIMLILMEYIEIEELKDEKSENKKPVSQKEEVSEIEVNTENKDEKEKIAVRINNCFVEVNKEILKIIQGEWLKFLDTLKLKNKKLWGLLEKTKVVAASNKYALLVSEKVANINLINDEYKEIKKMYSAYCEKKYIFVALSPEEWENKKSEYSLNIKKGYKYEFIKEQKEENNNLTELMAQNVFGTIYEKI